MFLLQRLTDFTTSLHRLQLREYIVSNNINVRVSIISKLLQAFPRPDKVGFFFLNFNLHFTIYPAGHLVNFSNLIAK